MCISEQSDHVGITITVYTFLDQMFNLITYYLRSIMIIFVQVGYHLPWILYHANQRLPQIYALATSGTGPFLLLFLFPGVA